eukprot:Ihof_evm5s329 gene=Ihof_evmTU5s329
MLPLSSHASTLAITEYSSAQSLQLVAISSDIQLTLEHVAQSTIGSTLSAITKATLPHKQATAVVNTALVPTRPQSTKSANYG